MPEPPFQRMTYRFAFHDNAVFVTLDGDVTMPDVRTATEALLRHPAWRPGLDVLWDFSQITSLAVTPEALRDLADFDSALMEQAGPGRTALVMRSTSDLAVGTLYTLLLRGGGRTHRAFSELGPAMAWLAREPSPATPEAAE